MADKEIDKVPRIVLDNDDIVSRRNATAARGAAVGVKSAATPSPAQSSSSRGLLVAVVVLAIVVLSGLAYLYQQLQQTQENLHAATARVGQLESRLASTDTSVTQSAVLLGARLKALDDATNANKAETHRVATLAEKNAKSNDTQSADIKNLQSSVKDAQTQWQQTTTQVTADSALLKTVDSATKENTQRLEVVQESLGGLETDSKSLKDKQQHFEGDMSKRVSTLEDTAKSTDVFRRNTQDELRKLREALVKVPAASGAPSSAEKPAN